MILDKILLLDDNKATNYIHAKFIKKADCTKNLVSFEVGAEALKYLADRKNSFPNLLFIDINMPTMDAWEFLDNYRSLARKEKNSAIIILLTTSLSPSDRDKVKAYSEINTLILKPLNPNSISFVLKQFFL